MDRLLTGAAAAKRVDRSRQLIQYWRDAGILPVARRIGGRPYYRLIDVLTAESATRAHPNSHRLVSA